MTSHQSQLVVDMYHAKILDSFAFDGTSQHNLHGSPLWSRSIDFDLTDESTTQVPSNVSGKRDRISRLDRYWKDLKQSGYDEHTLIEPFRFGDVEGPRPHDAAQPFRIVVHPQVELTADIHAHLCVAEVIGLLYGWFDAERRTLFIQLATPCTAVRRTDGGGTDVEIEQDCLIIMQTCFADKSPLMAVGWYHSHPTFLPHPSPIDLRTHDAFQAQTVDVATGLSPYVGLIVSSYWKDAASPLATHQWFCSTTYADPSEAKQPVGTQRSILLPMHLDVHHASFPQRPVFLEGKELEVQSAQLLAVLQSLSVPPETDCVEATAPEVSSSASNSSAAASIACSDSAVCGAKKNGGRTKKDTVESPDCQSNLPPLTLPPKRLSKQKGASVKAETCNTSSLGLLSASKAKVKRGAKSEASEVISLSSASLPGQTVAEPKRAGSIVRGDAQATIATPGLASVRESGVSTRHDDAAECLSENGLSWSQLTTTGTAAGSVSGGADLRAAECIQTCDTAPHIVAAEASLIRVTKRQKLEASLVPPPSRVSGRAVKAPATHGEFVDSGAIQVRGRHAVLEGGSATQTSSAKIEGASVSLAPSGGGGVEEKASERNGSVKRTKRMASLVLGMASGQLDGKPTPGKGKPKSRSVIGSKSLDLQPDSHEDGTPSGVKNKRKYAKKQRASSGASVPIVAAESLPMKPKKTPKGGIESTGKGVKGPLFRSIAACLLHERLRSSGLARNLLFGVHSEFRSLALTLISLGFHQSRNETRVALAGAGRQSKIDKVRCSALRWAVLLGIYEKVDELPAPSDEKQGVAMTKCRFLDETLLFLQACWADFSKLRSIEY